jgi:hypothetical protein
MDQMAAARPDQTLIARCETTLTIRLFTVLHEPMAGQKYRLEVGGRTFSAETNGEGILSHQVPMGVSTGRLILDMWVVDLEITPLDPPDQPLGLQARLQNLGYFDEAPGEGASEGGDTPAHLALMRFQSAYDLPAQGQMNGETKKKLLEVYGS